MRRLLYVLMVIAVAATVTSCGGNAARKIMVHEREASFSSVYLWETDGHTDYGLLMALKDGAADRLRGAGYSISTDPDMTSAYLKVTLYDAKAVNGSDGYIKGRVFIIEAAGRRVIYDVTAEVSGGVESGYPVDKFLEEAMSPLVSPPGEE